ncbi:MAG: metal ABC transporter ATP-binding protein [Candidatus Aenigmarchaeota archaeon]|nr:metal ABC transporter ATP-binding protein [Candidatus Aenigmarchaeota archaeon]
MNFTVKQGEVLIILGPNGAGKTTLLRALLNLIPYNGEIIWKTDKISYLPPQELVQRKYLPPLTIEDFFKFKHVSKNKILKILKDVKLPTNILRKNFNSLSTGQFQRMIIAWSLVNDPEVLLFDEIVYGIDIGGKETVYSLLHKLWKKRNLTILMVTHDLNIVWEHADNVLCLNKKKICYGKPKQILTIKNLEKTYGTGIKFYKHTHGD